MGCGGLNQRRRKTEVVKNSPKKKTLVDGGEEERKWGEPLFRGEKNSKRENEKWSRTTNLNAQLGHQTEKEKFTEKDEEGKERQGRVRTNPGINGRGESGENTDPFRREAGRLTMTGYHRSTTFNLNKERERDKRGGRQLGRRYGNR